MQDTDEVSTSWLYRKSYKLTMENSLYVTGIRQQIQVPHMFEKSMNLLSPVIYFIRKKLLEGENLLLQ